MQNIAKSIQLAKPIVSCSDKKDLFIKIEKDNDKTMYHTKIMMDVYKFGLNKKKNKCRISLRRLFNQSKVEEFNLFTLRSDDKFLGIYYGYKKPIKKIFVKYQVKGIEKSYLLSKTYYMEFRFKKGSIFCYFKSLFRLLKKENVNTTYNKTLFSMFTSLEKQVYEFYDKKYPQKGPLIKWIEKS
ncbi:DUF226 domain-containing protein [Borreliella burgdorferi]|uniref:DUF226 domain-containing protein n=1 Tax=Borreliella burgdorferi TaxID=139 RepID=UPI000D0261D8|nr:DUF226 domain-containing protein [Borreliella burgdorferi]MCD2386245.1 DUF226 domain-containing protein [Borreliella burgdorferi]MCD2387504.1 DUF226 domain-containing protein [Borreliella burgdorferi]MCD2390438.1 DUF226 domain-containing protein [Borreliella burgdorferi]PRR32131.1 hypothetical protein CV693_05745 [Borreliella burgdorferi]PRR35456.1 hypothetical protein CV687_05915 [Borreliella burgdorferi]